jgi:hypothetical protein
LRLAIPAALTIGGFSADKETPDAAFAKSARAAVIPAMHFPCAPFLRSRSLGGSLTSFGRPGSWCPRRASRRSVDERSAPTAV